MDRYWLLTSTFYGNWLPGEPRGFVSRVREERLGDPPSKSRHDHDQPGTPYDQDMAGLHKDAQERLRGPPIRINHDQAQTLLDQFRETVRYRGWQLLAVAIMSNHVHLVVGVIGDPDPSKVLGDFKAYGSRALNRNWGKPVSGTWWTYDGSKRKLRDEGAIRGAVEYIQNQENPLLVWINENTLV